MSTNAHLEPKNPCPFFEQFLGPQSKTIHSDRMPRHARSVKKGCSHSENPNPELPFPRANCSGCKTRCDFDAFGLVGS